jgi:hypothetical protein
MHAEEHNASWYSFEGDRYFFDFHNCAAKASSTKAGYPAANVCDSDSLSAWVAGGNGGIGESITITLTKPAHVDQIGVIPGFRRTRELYFANNRIERLEVAVNDGPPREIALPDDYIEFGSGSKKGYHLIDLAPYSGMARSITLTIRSVYRGTTYDDTCISQVLLRKRLVNRPEVQHAR